MNLPRPKRPAFRAPSPKFSLLLLPAFFLSVLSAGLTAWGLDPSISSAYGGGYYHYQNASPAYRHGVKTPFNSFPAIPHIPSVQTPALPVVPVPTMADLQPHPENSAQPYIGAGGVGYYSDEVMAEYDPDRYRNPSSGHKNLHHHTTDNPQEIPNAYRGSDSNGWDDRSMDGDYSETTDKPKKKTSKTSQKKKSNKKSSNKYSSSDDDNR